MPTNHQSLSNHDPTANAALSCLVLCRYGLQLHLPSKDYHFALLLLASSRLANRSAGRGGLVQQHWLQQRFAVQLRQAVLPVASQYLYRTTGYVLCEDEINGTCLSCQVDSSTKMKYTLSIPRAMTVDMT
jgi:hypothetical protein